MPEKAQHPYECTAKGHQGGSRTFLAAPPEWYEGKGISTPKNCPDCRKWVKAQTDERKRCASCGTEFRITANAKISYFKKDGPYVPVTECGRCQDGQRPEKGMDELPGKKKRKEEQEKNKPGEFGALKVGLPAQSRLLLKDGPFYRNVVTNYKINERETRGEHIAHHIPGNEFDWTTPSVANDKGLHEPTSPSIFASGTSLDELIATAQSFLNQTDIAIVREYRVRNRILRVTFTGDHDGLEFTFLEETPEGFGLISTYDNVSVKDIVNQKWYKEI